MATLAARPRLVERYRDFLPVTDATPVVSLGEGATPLVAARRLGAAIGVGNIFAAYLDGAMRNPSAAPQQFGNLIFGFAVTEALGIFGFAIALILIFAV